MEESDEDLIRKIALLQKRLERRKEKRKFETRSNQDAILSKCSSYFNKYSRHSVTGLIGFSNGEYLSDSRMVR